jgi:FtsH-binding integral membrane protein
MLSNQALETQVRTERSLLSRTMGWLGLSLAITAAGIYLWIDGVAPKLPWFVYFLVAIGLIFGIQAAAPRNQTLGAVLLAALSLVEGLFIAPIVDNYAQNAPDAVGSALLGTVGIFLVAAAVVYLTSINFLPLGRWLLGALLAGILVSVATLIFHLPISTLALSGFLGIVFVGLTLYDFSRVKAQRAGDNNALLLAVSLYLDFINLFLILLRIFGRRN